MTPSQYLLAAERVGLAARSIAQSVDRVALAVERYLDAASNSRTGQQEDQ